jgi:hypothetical protein
MCITRVIRKAESCALSSSCCFYSLPFCSERYTLRNIGAWRSLEAHLLWEQGVGGSNPSAPTSEIKYLAGNGFLGN